MAHSDLPHIKRMRANVAGLTKALASHQRNCASCSRARKFGRTDLLCETGWDWVKDLHKAQRRLERAQLDDAGQLHGQLALW